MNATANDSHLAEPSLDDGFNGARDAAILADSAKAGAVGGLVMVQATARTRDLLRRCGFAHVRTHALYSCPVRRDRFGRLQIDGAAIAAKSAA